jgi:hypothetical protein
LEVKKWAYAEVEGELGSIARSLGCVFFGLKVNKEMIF